MIFFWGNKILLMKRWYQDRAEQNRTEEKKTRRTWIWVNLLCFCVSFDSRQHVGRQEDEKQSNHAIEWLYLLVFPLSTQIFLFFAFFILLLCSLKDIIWCAERWNCRWWKNQYTHFFISPLQKAFRGVRPPSRHFPIPVPHSFACRISSKNSLKEVYTNLYTKSEVPFVL